MRLARSALALAAVAVCQAQLVKDWRVVRSEHFELVSRYDPAKTTELLKDLEWARVVLEDSLGAVSPFDERTLVLIPDNPYDYEKLSPSQYAAGHYIGSPERDVIVLRELFRARHSLLHEYTHLVMHRTGGRWPLWFNEGTAEFYGTLQRNKQGGVEAGAPEPYSVRLIRTGAWVPIAYLVGMDTSTDLPSEEFIGRFYAQAWLYVHMLRLAPAYKDRFADFRSLLASGTDTEEALRSVYGKSLNQFDEDARVWVRQKVFPTEALPAVPPVDSKVEAEVITDEAAAAVRQDVGEFVAR